MTRRNVTRDRAVRIFLLLHSSRSCLPTAQSRSNFADGLAEILPYLKTEITKRSDRAKGFVQLHKRWIVERTIALAQSLPPSRQVWENLNCSGLAFLKLASIRLLRKLCNASRRFESDSQQFRNELIKLVLRWSALSVVALS
jgi:hypothetical protein